MRDRIKVSGNGVIVPHATNPSQAEEMVAKFIKGSRLRISGAPEAYEDGGYIVPVSDSKLEHQPAVWGDIIRPDDAEYGSTNKDAY